MMVCDSVLRLCVPSCSDQPELKLIGLVTEMLPCPSPPCGSVNGLCALAPLPVRAFFLCLEVPRGLKFGLSAASTVWGVEPLAREGRRLVTLTQAGKAIACH